MLTAQVSNNIEVTFDPEATMPLGARSGAFTLQDQFGSTVKVPFTVTGEGVVDAVALKAASAEALQNAGYKLSIRAVQIAQ